MEVEVEVWEAKNRKIFPQRYRESGHVLVVVVVLP